MMINATLYIGNDIHVRSNSSLVDSVIESTLDTEDAACNPVMSFYDTLYTGFDLLNFDEVSMGGGGIVI